MLSNLPKRCISIRAVFKIRACFARDSLEAPSIMIRFTSFQKTLRLKRGLLLEFTFWPFGPFWPFRFKFFGLRNLNELLCVSKCMAQLFWYDSSSKKIFGRASSGITGELQRQQSFRYYKLGPSTSTRVTKSVSLTSKLGQSMISFEISWNVVVYKLVSRAGFQGRDFMVKISLLTKSGKYEVLYARGSLG